MSTTAPDITNDATIGQVIGPATATPTSTVTPTATTVNTATASPSFATSPTASPTILPTPISTFIPIIRRFKGQTLSIYGYGPGEAEIVLSGFGISEKTKSDNKGYFRFEEIYSYSSFYPDLCIQARDLENRVTQPSCIPALPVNSIIPFEVGPILLSPTISIDNNNVVVDQQSVARGMAIPNSEINIYLAKNYYIPTYQIQSKMNGSYEFSLPTAEVSSYLLFASSRVGGDLSAKSTTLFFSVISETKSVLQNTKEFLIYNKIGLLIVLELIVIMILGILVLKEPKRRKKISLRRI